jgi:hypothetical protein
MYSHNTNVNRLPEYGSVKVSTYGILYLGTPHLGVGGTSVTTTALNIASIFVDTNSKYYKNLERHSDWLQQQCTDYLSISTDFVTKYFYETRETHIALGKRRMVQALVLSREMQCLTKT